MATILLTWELGANVGYVHPLGAIATELKRRGHRVVVGVKDLVEGERHLTPLGIDIIQAPIWSGCTDSRMPPAVNYAELLMRSGYLDIEQVSGQIRSWINLIALLKPDMILGYHSPSALLAAKITGINAVQFGYGFVLPPQSSVMPSMQPWAKVPQERFVSSEERVLRIINKALDRCKGKPLSKLSEIFSTACYLNTLPETDHYGVRENVKYWGLVQSSRNSVEPNWPELEGPKVYVYMQTDSRPYKALINSLKKLEWPSLVVSRGIKDKEAELYNADNITFSSSLVNLDLVAKQASVVVTNCNHGTTVELLQKGCKLLVIPLQVEQALLAHRLSNRGLVISAAADLASYSELIEKAHNSLELKNKVANFHQTYGNINPQYQLSALIDDIESKLIAQ